MPRSGRVARVARMLVLVPFAVHTVAGSVAGAQSPGLASFELVARADVFNIAVRDDRVPVIPQNLPTFALSPGTAQALVTSAGTSRGVAAAPDPGPVVRTLPGTLAGLGLPRLPDYPAAVTSDYPVSSGDDVDQGVYHLSVISDATSTVSQVEVGALHDDPMVATYAVEAITKVEGDTLVAEATSGASALRVGDLLAIGSVQSRARVVVGPDGEMMPSSSLQIDGLSLSGIGLVITDEGIAVAGIILPIGPDPLIELLAGAGIDMEYIPQQIIETDSSVTVISAGLRVYYEVIGPDGGKTDAEVTFGRTVATASSTPFPAIPPPLEPAPDPGVDTGFGSVPPAATPPTSVPSIPDPAVAAPELEGETPSQGPSSVLAGIPMGPIEADFYLILVAAAASSLIGSRVMRAATRFGVKE